MKPHERSSLVSRLNAACAERSIPKFARDADDDFERRASVETLKFLWSNAQIPEEIPDDIAHDEARIRSGLIWLTHDEFRFAFLRLMVMGVAKSSEAAIWAVVEVAAEPIPKYSRNPPKKFANFSPSDVHLTKDVISSFVADMNTEKISETGYRIYLRSHRNWQAFSAAFE